MKRPDRLLASMSAACKQCYMRFRSASAIAWLIVVPVFFINLRRSYGKQGGIAPVPKQQGNVRAGRGRGAVPRSKCGLCRRTANIRLRHEEANEEQGERRESNRFAFAAPRSIGTFSQYFCNRRVHFHPTPLLLCLHMPAAIHRHPAATRISRSYMSRIEKRALMKLYHEFYKAKR